MILKRDTVNHLVTALANKKAADDVIGALDRGINGPNASNQFTRYVNQSSGDDSYDGSPGYPFKTLEKALASIPDGISHTIKLAAGNYSAAAGFYTWKPLVNLVGDAAQNTAVNSPINLVAPSGAIFTINNIAVNGLLTLDLTGAPFASVSLANGAFRLNRVDNNPNCIVTMVGGIFASTLSGSVVMQGYLFDNVDVEPGTTVYASALSYLGGTFTLHGDAVLKTVACLFSVAANPVIGVIESGNTPVWNTDAASDFGFSGSVTKNVY